MLNKIMLSLILSTLIISTTTIEMEYFSFFNCFLQYSLNSNGTLTINNCSSSNGRNGNFYYTSWPLCNQACCELSINNFPSLTLSSIQKCHQNNDSLKQAELIKIIMIAIGSTLFSIFVVIVAYQIAMKCIETASKIMPDDDEPLEVNQTELTSKPIWISLQFNETHQSLTIQNQNQNIQCSICLDQLPYLSTPCKHFFHLTCLLLWLNKSQDCPLCKRVNLKQLKLYCRSCGIKVLLLPMKKTKNNLQDWETFDNKCNQCLMEQQKLGGQQQSFERLKEIKEKIQQNHQSFET